MPLERGTTGSPNITVGSVTGTTGSFSGSVSIGGTLTYEDVTNVDSVGIVTTRTGTDLQGFKVEEGKQDGSTSLNGEFDFLFREWSCTKILCCYWWELLP